MITEWNAADKLLNLTCLTSEQNRCPVSD